MFLTFEDCLALCDLTEEEVLTISRHEGIPPMSAVQLGDYLVRTEAGEQHIKAMIRDDITAALARGDRLRALALKAIIRDYILRHPRCEARHCAGGRPIERREPRH